MTRRALRLPGSRRQWRRALRFALTWLAVVLGLAGLGLQPAVPLLAAVAVTAYTLVVTTRCVDRLGTRLTDDHSETLTVEQPPATSVG